MTMLSSSYFRTIPLRHNTNESPSTMFAPAYAPKNSSTICCSLPDSEFRMENGCTSLHHLSRRTGWIWSARDKSGTCSAFFALTCSFPLFLTMFLPLPLLMWTLCFLPWHWDWSGGGYLSSALLGHSKGTEPGTPILLCPHAARNSGETVYKFLHIHSW